MKAKAPKSLLNTLNGPKPIVHWLVVPRFRLLGLARVYVAVRGEGDKAVWKTKAQLEPALTY